MRRISKRAMSRKGVSRSAPGGLIYRHTPTYDSKRCPDCLQYKPLSDFPRNLRTKSGYTTYCKLCHNARGSETSQRLDGGRRHYHLKRRYGIGAAEFDMSEPTRCGGGRRRLLSMAGRIFGRAQGAPTYPIA